MDIDLHELLKKDFGVDLPISGGSGNSRDEPILIHYHTPNDYVAVEYNVLGCLGAGRGIEWKVIQQALITHNGRDIDQIKIEARWATATELITQTENYYFDITECMGKGSRLAADATDNGEVDELVRQMQIDLATRDASQAPQKPSIVGTQSYAGNTRKRTRNWLLSWLRKCIMFFGT